MSHSAVANEVVCAIDVERQATTFNVKAMVSAATGTTGTFRISATSSSGGNRSQITQSGRFEGRTGAPTTVASLSLSGAGRAEIVLDVLTELSASQCRRDIGDP